MSAPGSVTGRPLRVVAAGLAIAVVSLHALPAPSDRLAVGPLTWTVAAAGGTAPHSSAAV